MSWPPNTLFGCLAPVPAAGGGAPVSDPAHDDDETLLLFLSSPLEGMSPLAVEGERCAAAQVLEDVTTDEPLREYLRHRIEACDALLEA